MGHQKTITWNRIGDWQFRYVLSSDYKTNDKFNHALGTFKSLSQEEPDLTIEFALKPALQTRIDEIAALPPLFEYKRGLLYTRIRKTVDGGYLWMFGKKALDNLAFSTNSDWGVIKLLFDHTGTDGDLAYEYLIEVVICALLNFGGVIFHGAVLDYQKRGIILSAPSGTGKTTHAQLWRDAGFADIINGDRALCRKTEGQWKVFGMPWCGSSGESENRQVPLAAIVVLEQSDVNSVRRLNPLDALTHLLPNIQAPKWETTLYNKALDRLDEIIPEVPIYLLRCRPDVDAMMTLKQEMDRLPDQGGKA